MTPEQVKQNFHKQGITFTDWAKQNNFSRHIVYQVINGNTKSRWGQAHQIAVALGIKPPPTK